MRSKKMFNLYIYIFACIILFNDYDMLATLRGVCFPKWKPLNCQEFELPDVVGCVLSTRLKDL